MPNHKDQHNGSFDGNADESSPALDRRRVLQLAGAGVVGGALAVGTASGAGSTLPHRIAFDGSATTTVADYAFAVSEAVEPDGDVGGTEDGDAVDGTAVTGSVHQDVDAYYFSGTLTQLDVSGQVSVSIDYGDRTVTDADRLEIVTPADGSVEYTFTADGEVTYVLDNGRNSAEENNDSIVDNGDGTWTVEGMTGNGYGDTFDLSGTVTGFQASTEQYSLLLNGEQVTVAELLGEEQTGTLDEAVFRVGFDHDAWLDYRIHVDAEPTALTTDEDEYYAASNSDITELSDGTWLIDGRTGTADPSGPMYGDGYRWTPAEGNGVLGFEATSDQDQDYYVSINGDEVDPATLPPLDLPGEEEPETLDEAVFRVGFDHDAWLDYRIHVDADPDPLTKDEDEYYAASNSDITELSDGTWLIDGRTGTADPTGPMYGDGYRWTPAEGNGVLGFEASSTDDLDYQVSINGDAVDPATLPAMDLPEDDTTNQAENGPIGGGSGYDQTIDRAEADVVVRTRSELASALSGASAGDVVYVPGSETIDMASGGLTVPAGVTVASNRGISDADGALLYTDREPTELLRLSRNARVSGLRIRGPNPRDEGGSSSIAHALAVFGDGVEIDNCDVWAFSYAGIYVRDGDAHIHHNVLRECNKSGLGYGVSMVSGHPLIEYNYFNLNRHSTASDGEHHGYTARYNHFGPEATSHVIDAHEPANVRIEILNNVVEADEATHGHLAGHRTGTCKIRGIPDDVATFKDNWFFNPLEPRDSPNGNNTGEAIVQWADVSEWTNVGFTGNYYGEDANVSFSDIIPGYTGWRKP